MSKFVMAGRCSSKELTSLRRKDIDHRGIVSDEEKIDLYSRAKVFLFPSLFEGFDIAVREALSAKLIVITWKIPAFEEVSLPVKPNLKLVKVGDNELFVKKHWKQLRIMIHWSLLEYRWKILELLRLGTKLVKCGQCS